MVIGTVYGVYFGEHGTGNTYRLAGDFSTMSDAKSEKNYLLRTFPSSKVFIKRSFVLGGGVSTDEPHDNPRQFGERTNGEKIVGYFVISILSGLTTYFTTMAVVNFNGF